MIPDAESPPERIQLADEDLRRILERAAQIDAERETGLTVEDLRQIAAETGISSEALAIALREAERGQLAAEPAEGNAHTEAKPERATPIGRILRRVPGWIRTIGLAWGSTITGFFAGLSASELPNGEMVAVAAFVALVWGSFELAVFHRRRGSLLTYERDLLALWLPFTTLGTMLGGPGSDEGFFIAGSIFWSCLAVIGGLIATVRMSRKEQPVSAE